MNFRRSLLVLVVLLAVANGGVRAQWKLLLSNALQDGGQGHKALHGKGGIVWVGGWSWSDHDIYLSTDTGRTWKSISFAPFQGNTEIFDINFFDAQTAVITSNAGIYLTTNQGAFWKQISPEAWISTVAFGSSAKIIYAANWSASPSEDVLMSSTDGGQTWKNTDFGGSQCQNFTFGRDGTIYVNSLENSKQPWVGWINTSTDGGQTWSQNTGSYPADCITMVSDSCDTRRLYLANENYFLHSDSDRRSRLFLSTDAGTTWQTTFDQAIGVVAGSMAAGPTVVYAGTTDFTPDSMGVLRSLDHGMTWKSIGGPASDLDTRSLTALSDNILFAIDYYGNIWGTYNSGGDSVRAAPVGKDTLIISSSSLFTNDTLDCVDSIVRTLQFQSVGCSPPSVSQIVLAGPDSQSYSIGQRATSHITVVFHPLHDGPSQGALFLIRDDGHTDTISLGGYKFQDPRPNTLSVTPISLFQNDSVACSDSLRRSISISITGCMPPSVASRSIEGVDSNCYRIAYQDSDSVVIVFRPEHAGSCSAVFTLHLDDGTTRSVSLGGYNVIFPDVFTYAPSQLFDKDTIQCANTTTKTVVLNSSGCIPPQIASHAFAGSDAASYIITSLDKVSIIVEFISQHPGPQPAQLLLTLSNGTVDTVYLLGTGAAPHSLSLTSQNQSTDTIGGDISVPITIAGLAKPEDVNLVLHFDSSLKYHGSFDASNAKLDILNERWPGRSKLTIKNVTPGTVAAWARFTVFSDSNEHPQVTFDSVQVLTTSSPCEYLLPDKVTATITPPSGCGIPIISKLMQGEPFRFSIRPNPTTGQLTIESPQNIGDVSVTVFDALGIQRLVANTTILRGVPIQIELPGSDGMYYVRIKSQFGEYASRVVVLK